MVQHKESSAILIRLAYILGNLTTTFVEARQKLCEQESGEAKNCFVTITELAVFYLEKDSLVTSSNTSADLTEETKQTQQRNSKYLEFTTGHLEDALTKVIKLLANISTEEEIALNAYTSMPNELLSKFIMQVCEAIDRRCIGQNEEFILNAISAVTNILFYDSPE